MNPPGWLVDRLPEWARSIRFRYTLLYSAVLFGLAAVVVAAIYLVLVMSLRGEPVSPTYTKQWCSDVSDRRPSRTRGVTVYSRSARSYSLHW